MHLAQARPGALQLVHVHAHDYRAPPRRLSGLLVVVLLAPQRCENRVVPYFDLEHRDPAADGTADALARPDTELVTVPWTTHDLPVLAVDVLVGRGGEHCAGDPS